MIPSFHLLSPFARDWFVARAEKKGIPFRAWSLDYEAELRELQTMYDQIVREDVTYPPYYLKPFHGYKHGNLNWEAACEMKAATASMTSDYWPGVAFAEAAEWVRSNFTESVASRQERDVKAILDLGCSTGISTNAIQKAFPHAMVVGADLSPQFLAVAAKDYNVKVLHANAECLPLPKRSFDLVTASYLFHEVPRVNTRSILQEAYRLLRHDGMFAIVDLDQEKLKRRLKNRFRRMAFESTEPHIVSYYSTSFSVLLREAGFRRVEKISNDPLNSMWLALK